VLEIEYEVQEAGWALAKVRNDNAEVEMTTSYLHDSLKELAEVALYFVKGGNAAKVVFMDEPGEHQIWLERINDKELKYTVVWYDDWESWEMYPSDKYKTLLKGICTDKRLKHQVTNILWGIYENLGEDKYLELWGEHKFPTELYQELNAA
jgi:hypothetical protein